jgi:hypothetical protein
MKGIGLALATQVRRRPLKVAGVGAGLHAAIGLHATWNAASLAEQLQQFVWVLFLPTLAGIAVVLHFSFRREVRIVRRQLADSVAAGLLSQQQYDSLLSIRGRRAALRDARRSPGGATARDAMANLIRSATDLAFLRNRFARVGLVPDPAAEAPLVIAIEQSQAVLGSV